MLDLANGSSASTRPISLAGWFIVLLAGGSALLPAVGTANGGALIGTLLIMTGLAEFIVGTLRHQTRKLAIAAGAVTVIAGLLFWSDLTIKLMPSVTIILAWLFLRALILGAASALEHGSVRLWTGLSALTDLLLALILAAGVSISALVVSLFGETPPLVASFAWVLAISFVTTGTLLIEVARCGAREDI